MNRQAFEEMVQRWQFEHAELLNHGGKAITALFRLILVSGMVTLLAAAALIGILDDQLPQAYELETRTRTEVSHQWQQQQNQ